MKVLLLRVAEGLALTTMCVFVVRMIERVIGPSLTGSLLNPLAMLLLALYRPRTK